MTLNDLEGHISYVKACQIPYVANVTHLTYLYVFIMLHIIGYMFTASVDASEVSKCYSVDSENCCFYTNGSLLSLNEAREFCESRRLTLPIIVDAETDSVFQRFIVDDSFNVIQNRSVWIDGYARDSDNTHWRWISGRQSGRLLAIIAGPLAKLV